MTQFFHAIPRCCAQKRCRIAAGRSRRDPCPGHLDSGLQERAEKAASRTGSLPAIRDHGRLRFSRMARGCHA